MSGANPHPEPNPVPAPAPESAVVDVAPAVTPVTTEPAPAAAEPFAPHTETPSLLSAFGKDGASADAKPAEPAADQAPTAPPGDKPAEAAAKPGETKPGDPAVDAKPPEPAAPEPIQYPDWKLPQNVKPDAEMLGKYTEALSEHRVPAEAGQKLLDMHAEALQHSMQSYADFLAREQHRVFGETRQSWRNEAMADPEIGGAGHHTAMGVIARMRDRLVSDHKPGTPEYLADAKAFDQFLTVTGAGDHPAFLKVMYRVGKFLDEPALPPPNVGPVPNGGTPKGRLRDNYTNMPKT
jgi:hypothetical protein